MFKHTSFKIGGCADVFVIPYDKYELKNVISICLEFDVPYFILGNGSNVIVRDNGFRGVIIHIGEHLSNVTVDGKNIYAEAGILLGDLANIACENNLSGLEFAHGIPGSLGGAVYMNAGAYDGEMSHVIKEAYVLSDNTVFDTIDCSNLEFGYRKSVIQSKNYIVVGACISLKDGTYSDIKAKMLDLQTKRKSKQPLNFPSAGSTFKRPAGFFAGKLIMDSGLSGFSIGGATVSDKHCGFIVNSNNATASNVLDLIDYVIETVYSKFGVVLEPEVKVIGD